jgi:hypothetical protein
MQASESFTVIATGQIESCEVRTLVRDWAYPMFKLMRNSDNQVLCRYLELKMHTVSGELFWVKTGRF